MAKRIKPALSLSEVIEWEPKAGYWFVKRPTGGKTRWTIKDHAFSHAKELWPELKDDRGLVYDRY